VRGTEDLLRGVSGRKFRLKGPELLPEEKNQQLLQFCHSNSPAMFILLYHVSVYINTHKYIPMLTSNTQSPRGREMLFQLCLINKLKMEDRDMQESLDKLDRLIKRI
jgi:hypothetical protein